MGKDNFFKIGHIRDLRSKNGVEPAWKFICSHNRGPGKTTAVSKHVLDRYFQEGEQFALMTRNIGDLGNIAGGILASALKIFYPRFYVSERQVSKGAYSEIYIHALGEDEEEVKELCGYVFPINACDKIKKYSGYFNYVKTIFFDEFMPNHKSTYISEEVDKFLNIVDSVARGVGHSVRDDINIYLCSNTITLENPYFWTLGLTRMIQSNTNSFINDYVAFQRFEKEGLKEERNESRIHAAVRNSPNFVDNDIVWFNDSGALVSNTKGWGKGYYRATLNDLETSYGLRWYPKKSLFHISRVVEADFGDEFDLHIENARNGPFINNSPLGKMIKEGIFDGIVYFSNNQVKNRVFDIMIG